MPSDKEDDLAVLKQVEPYLRSALAFLLYLRYESMDVDPAYEVAGLFIERLRKDREAAE